MQPNRARQHLPLKLAALLRQVGYLVAVAHPTDVLIDDRPLIQIARHVMGGGTDDLDAPGLRLMIRPCAHERG